MTITHLKSLIGELSLPVFDDGKSVVICPFHHGGQVFNVVMHLQEEGNYLQFSVPCFLNLQEASVPEKVVLKLLELNKDYKVLKFTLDPQDGEITVGIEVYMNDNDPSLAQMSRCLYGLTVAAMQERERLQTLFKFGFYPSSEDPGFTDNLDRILAGTDLN